MIGCPIGRPTNSNHPGMLMNKIIQIEWSNTVKAVTGPVRAEPVTPGMMLFHHSPGCGGPYPQRNMAPSFIHHCVRPALIIIRLRGVTPFANPELESGVMNRIRLANSTWREPAFCVCHRGRAASWQKSRLPGCNADKVDPSAHGVCVSLPDSIP